MKIFYLKTQVPNVQGAFCNWHVAFHVSLLVLFLCVPSAPASIADAIDQVQPKMVKIYGAGGFRDMVAYQSGFPISPNGHILTAFSHVLDTDYITAVLADGRKFDAKLLGVDPRLDLAVLKIDAAGLPSFDLSQAARADAGQTILAFSNIFGVAAGNEPASVQKGTVAVVTRLEARRGVFKTPYRGPVYVLDATTNNPGAAGGALVTRQGVLIGMLGKELRNAINNTWLNYAIPIDVLRQPVDDIRHGKTADRPATEARQNPEHPLDLASLGIVLIPDLLERTPPYVDYVQPGSPAAKAGIQPDDLILLLGDRLMPSRKALAADLETIDAENAVKLTLLRGEELVEVTLRAAGTVPTTRKVRP